MSCNFHANRISTLRQLLKREKLDAMIVSIPENRYYLSGFAAEDINSHELAGTLFITQKKLLLATDERFKLQASIDAPHYDILCYNLGLAEKLPKIIKQHGVKTIGFESAHFSHKLYTKCLHAVIKNQCNSVLTPTENLIEKIRIIKSEHEIEKIRNAVRLTENAFQKLLTIIHIGMTEKEAAWILEKIIRELGADGLSFPTIIASGPNSAMPHAKVTDKKFEIGEPILCDWGVKLDGYCSDMSRTITIGTPSDKFISVYNTVVEAQKKAIATIKSGISARAVDDVARNYINSTEYFGKFIHSLGHGTGLAVHEAPRLSQSETEMLKTGMVITVEPGIYIPNWGGVRIENQLVVHKNSCQIINQNKPFDYQIRT